MRFRLGEGVSLGVGWEALRGDLKGCMMEAKEEDWSEQGLAEEEEE